jgi:hypothetical protein
VRAVAQHRDPVGHREDLLHPVAHVDHRDALRAQSPDQREQQLDLGVGQRAGRLVERDHPRPVGERAQNLHQLALRRGEPGGQGGRVQYLAEAAPVDQLGRPGRQLGPAQQSPARGQRADEDVLRDADLRNDLRLLRDDPDAGRAGRRRIGKPHRPTVQLDAALVDRQRGHQHLQQRRLAGAVLAHQRGDLTGPELDAHLPQRRDRPERLADRAHPQCEGVRCHGRLRCTSGWCAAR